MLIGILAGFTAALLQALSYLCSRHFMQRHDSPLLLVIYSQLVMGVIGLLMLPWVDTAHLYDDPAAFAWTMGWWLLTITAGQITFFLTLRRIEASKISSLLGLKIIVLALLAVTIFHQRINAWQALAILLSTIAAVAINHSGGERFHPRGLLWLGCALVTYSLSDIFETRLVRMVRGADMTGDGLAICAVCYAALGLLTLPALAGCRRDWKIAVAATPFAVTWYYAMTALFVCFGSLGTVFGNVIQASRGVLSVLLGLLLIACGVRHLEAAADRRAWFRRLAAALLMTAAIAIYVLASR